MRSPFLQAFADLPRELPIFPLSGAVVLPGVQLPLNIFEPRYLNMVAAALAQDHLIGMVQPRADADAAEPPPVHRIGCAGRITSYSETTDGRIVMVLTGLCRFEIVEELPERDGYRRIRPDWSRFSGDYDLDGGSIGDRERFMGSLRAFCDQRSVEVPWEDIGKMADDDLVNLLCTHLPLGADDKQALLETDGIGARADLMRGLMEMSAFSGATGGSEQRH
ncbi:LON peptidase substrate-binding domain-containing protein [uncultured Thiohalocapsa sp.]|uniref:LON peptidase substrate-binding domain-containing protein n=1 Tax=uncultured Thiohalocapsa sp. TaxID=768990 RepID=UPI0025FE5845|nr:LON peptidase substrate-binding domain-containing protein [uncultured Thiohalocapsa sp.]